MRFRFWKKQPTFPVGEIGPEIVTQPSSLPTISISDLTTAGSAQVGQIVSLAPDGGAIVTMNPAANATATPGIPTHIINLEVGGKTLAKGIKAPQAGLPETAKPRRAKKPSGQIRPRPTQKRAP